MLLAPYRTYTAGSSNGHFKFSLRVVRTEVIFFPPT